ncbi:MAG: hypothetical protein ABFS38_06010 [Bacteroidota bacterium]
MNPGRLIILLFLFSFACAAQSPLETGKLSGSIKPFHFHLPTDRQSLHYTDTDSDGDPDLLQYLILDTIPILWIDDDDDMKQGDLTGDLDNDCLMIDLNSDGKYGEALDIIIDWNDENSDGIADMQMILENSEIEQNGKWSSHYIYMINTDQKAVFNNLDWELFKMQGWERMGRCNFLSNYRGNNLMLKAHISSFDIEDPRFNWENPFLFYDKDQDGYTEMALRLVDEPEFIEEPANEYSFRFTKKISLAQLTIDLDNDNGPDNELDYDMSLKFFGKGFNYGDQVHTFNNMKGLEGTTEFLYDKRIRRNQELVYCDHDTAYGMIFDRGNWDGCWLVFDEDDDCHRWERVEFYEPKDPFIMGAHQGGLDHNPQADVSGDRGEWDTDFSGEGNLYISSFDHKIHLLGAEEGFWRIDQFAEYYQGWQGWRGPNIQPEDMVFTEPTAAPLIRYEDTDQNGFFDLIEYDMDADHNYEERISLIDLNLTDTFNVIITADLTYEDYQQIFRGLAEKSWEAATAAYHVAETFGLECAWYNNLLHPQSIAQKYNYGYWLSFYIFEDLKAYCRFKEDDELLKKIERAYVTSDWDQIIGHQNDQIP